MENYKMENGDSDDFFTLNYVITNYHKFLLLILVFLIVYFTDYISNINSMIYSPIPIIHNVKNIPNVPNILNSNINMKKSKKNFKIKKSK